LEGALLAFADTVNIGLSRAAARKVRQRG